MHCVVMASGELNASHVRVKTPRAADSQKEGHNAMFATDAYISTIKIDENQVEGAEGWDSKELKRRGGAGQHQVAQSSRAALIKMLKEEFEKLYNACLSMEDDELEATVKAFKALVQKFRSLVVRRKGSRAAARNNVFRHRESRRSAQKKS